MVAGFARRDLEVGDLVAPFDLNLTLSKKFYLVEPDGLGDRHDIRQFCQWLRHQKF